jgi:FAD dependent oxidoreductase
VLVYGSTPAGIMAAVAASRHLLVTGDGSGGRATASSSNTFTNTTTDDDASTSGGPRVALLSQREHIGGMCSGGLGETNIGGCADEVIGGLTKEFFQRNAIKYQTIQPRAPWNLEPHVDKQVFMEMLHDANVTLLPFGQVESVVKNENGDIEYITMTMSPDDESTRTTRKKKTK